jgi:hypothetical protein
MSRNIGRSSVDTNRGAPSAHADVRNMTLEELEDGWGDLV